MAVRQILVVDDESLIRTVLAEILRAHGYGVDQACDADAARGLLRSSSDYDLVITDIQMPGASDGLALADHLASSTPVVPVLIMTGRPELLRRALRSHERFLSKPFGAEQLLEKVGELAPVH